MRLFTLAVLLMLPLAADVSDSLAWRCLRRIAQSLPLADDALPATPPELVDPLAADPSAALATRDHQSHIVPSSRRATGSCFGLYGYLAASFSSIVTPWPADSPQKSRPSLNE